MKKLFFLVLALVLCVSMCACGESGKDHEHDWNVVTTSPTCLAGGYDTKTCKICGAVETCNQTKIGKHDYSTAPDTDKDCHWYKCTVCGKTTKKEEHIPSSAGACSVCNASVSPTEGIIYDTSSDKTYAKVIGYTGTKKNILIASEYNGLPVKSIYIDAFKNKTITSVAIPDGVTDIGGDAFAFCSKIKSVAIPGSVTSISMGAFRYCRSLVSITIPEGVSSIGGYAFQGCSGLASISIPDSVTDIGKDVFDLCSALYKEYEFGKYVGDESNPYAVLVKITNKNLSTYKIHEKTKFIPSNTFSGCSRLESITIPNSVTLIDRSAFSGCSSLTSITIPNSVTSIGEWSFHNCSALKSITIPDSVTSIGGNAFYECSSLTSITIPDSVTSIGEWTFSDCSSLASITIPDSVTSIEKGAFSFCNNLTDIYYTGTKTQWDKISIASNNYRLDDATIHYNHVVQN